MTGAVATLRRLTGSPLSPARQRLADAIGAKAAANERATLLDRALSGVRAEADAAEAALSVAREAAASATARSHEHVVARITGRPAPDVPSRAAAAAMLAEAEHGAEDAVAAARAISAELEQLQAGERERAERIAGAARAVLADELHDSAAALIAEIDSLHHRLIDAGRAFQFLWKIGVVSTGADATPGARAASDMLAHPPMASQLWLNRDSSPTEAKLAGVLEALMADATAPVPTLR